MKRRKAAEDPLHTLAGLAAVIDTQQFADDVSATDKKRIRAVADNLRGSFEKTGLDVNPQTLLAFWLGCSAQSQMDRANPVANVLASLTGGGDSGTPNVALSATVAYLARDILAGRRVE